MGTLAGYTKLSRAKTVTSTPFEDLKVDASALAAALDHDVLTRRLGYRLTDEEAIKSVKPWKRIDNGSVVNVHDAFTTRAFGDSSLIFVTDYHPLSKTLLEEHFTYHPRYQAGRSAAPHVPEQVLWGYIVQITSALKGIHSTGLAARVIHPSKILLTSKNRIRLNGCGILDVVQYDSARSLIELQQEDLVQLGRLILCIANSNTNAVLNLPKTLDNVTRLYSLRLKESVAWLLSPQPAAAVTQSPTSNATATKDIDSFLRSVFDQVTTALDKTFHTEDLLLSTLNRELENGRLVRLLMKLNFINERPEFEHSPQWSETGERYYLKLFRDYVFHQVDADGHPVVDLAHAIRCMNKLDAGSDELVNLVSRDEQNCLVVSYKELKRGIEKAFQELAKAERR